MCKYTQDDQVFQEQKYLIMAFRKQITPSTGWMSASHYLPNVGRQKYETREHKVNFFLNSQHNGF